MSMYAIVLHESGAVDVKSVADLQREGLALVRAGVEPNRYTVLGMEDVMRKAMDRAAELRKELRKSKKASIAG